MKPERRKRTVLCVVNYYLPGFKGGGPVRSVSNMCRKLGDEFDIRVISRDRDFGDSTPYPGIQHGRWTKTDKTLVWYLSPPRWRIPGLTRIVEELKPDLIYLQSFFNLIFTIYPLLLRRLRLIPRGLPVLIAPRGEFSPGALAIKPQRKRIFIRATKMLGLYRDVVWHATGDEESHFIRLMLGNSANVLIAGNLAFVPTEAAPQPRQVKTVGNLHIAFLSRITPKKNLHGAIEFLARTSASIRFDIYGPIVDAQYWEECQRAIARLPRNVTVVHKGEISNADVDATLSRYDMFFLPTLGENFGHVILEALLAGCPVLLSDRTPWRNLASRKAGFDLPLDEPEGFREAIEMFAGFDAPRLEEWSRGARTYGLEIAEKDKAIEATRELLNRAMSGSFS